MRILFLLFVLFPSIAFATLTPGTIPVTKTGGSAPVLQNGSITDTGTASGTGNVGIGSTNPGQALDVQGTVRATGFIGVSDVTYVVCSSTHRSNWNCDYTATGTNDQVTINAAITAANALTYGGHVLLTEGSFNIGGNGNPIVPLSNVWLQGSGMYGTTVLSGNVGLAPNSSGTGIVTQTSQITNNFRISDMKIDGTPMRSGTWGVQEKGISITDGTSGQDDNIMVDHVWVYHTPATCIATDGGTHQIITHNLIDSCGTNGQGGTGGTGFPEGNNGFGYGTYGNSGVGINLNVVVSENICKSVVDACILFEEQPGTTTASWGITIDNNVDYGSYNTVRISGDSGVIISNNVSYNTTNSSYAIISDTFANVNYKDIIISNNYSYLASVDGISILTTPGIGVPINILIDGNIIDQCTNFGINAYSGYTVISNNQIYKCGEDGIYWLSGQSITGLKIIGNNIYNNGTSSTSQHESAINIKINSSYTLTQLDIENNLLTGNTGYGLDTELSAGIFSNFSLKNNDLSGNTLGATLLTGSTFTVGNNFFPFGNHGYTANNYVEGSMEVATNVGINSLTPGSSLDVQGTARFLIGNVGIGSTNPGDILDVQGTVRVNGNLAGGTTGNVGIGTAVANSATCDSTCNTAGQRCLIGMTVPLTGFEPCSASISGDCLCLSVH